MIWAFLTTVVLAADVPDLYQQSYDAEAALDYSAALAALQSMPAAEQQTYLHQLRRGWLHYLAGAPAASIGAYDEAIRSAPEALEPKIGKLQPLMVSRRYLEAEKLTAEILQRAPGDHTVLLQRAWALYSLGRFDAAIEAYSRVLALYPADVEARAGLGWSALKEGKKDQARKAFEEVLWVAPRHTSARQGLSAL